MFGSGWSQDVTQSNAYEHSVRTTHTTGASAHFIAGNAQQLAVVATRGAGGGTLLFKLPSVVVGNPPTCGTNFSSIGSVSLGGSSQPRRQVWQYSHPAFSGWCFTLASGSSKLVDLDAILTIGED